jgi:cytochrome P450
LPENKDQIQPYTFLPFGNGPHGCVGMRLAYLEAKIGIVHVCHKFLLMRDAKTEVGEKGKNMNSNMNILF